MKQGSIDNLGKDYAPDVYDVSGSEFPPDKEAHPGVVVLDGSDPGPNEGDRALGIATGRVSSDVAAEVADY
jgi:hypothetical protein